MCIRDRGTAKDMCANIDMYSGFVYSMMGIPEDLFTPLFACARMSGWAAHRFEEIVSGKRIIRPAYKSTPVSYTHLDVYKRQAREGAVVRFAGHGRHPLLVEGHAHDERVRTEPGLSLIHI